MNKASIKIQNNQKSSLVILLCFLGSILMFSNLALSQNTPCPQGLLSCPDGSCIASTSQCVSKKCSPACDPCKEICLYINGKSKCVPNGMHKCTDGRCSCSQLDCYRNGPICDKCTEIYNPQTSTCQLADYLEVEACAEGGCFAKGNCPEKCNPKCDPCKQVCVFDSVVNRYTCIDSAEPDSRKCLDGMCSNPDARKLCSEDCNPKCKPCTETCMIGENNTKKCVPTSNKICSNGACKRCLDRCPPNPSQDLPSYTTHKIQNEIQPTEEPSSF